MVGKRHDVDDLDGRRQCRAAEDGRIRYVDGVISSAQKGRGLGGCFSSSTWTWDGRAFALTSEATTGMRCQIAVGGAWNLPTLVTRVHKAR